MRNPPRAPVATAERILETAERLVQTQGFNAFSYADIAEEVGITKASLHYHFPTKVKLGARLISRYTETFQRALLAIDESHDDARQKLESYVRLYESVLRNNRMCLCGMLAADYATLPRPMRELLKTFFDVNESWLAQVLEQGRAKKQLRLAGPAQEEARLLLAGLEGAMLVARSYSEVGRFNAVAARLLAALGAGKRRGQR